MRDTRTVWFLALLLAVAGSGHATTLIERDAADLADRAELIFVGTVAHTEVAATKAKDFAYTYVTFQVDEALKGTAKDAEITLRFAGGAVGLEIYEVVGVPTFRVGDKHLLFVEGNTRLGCPLVGWSQGKLDFVAHPLTGEAILVDADGRIVEGIEGRQWRRGTLHLAPGGLIETGAGPGVEVLAEENVQITVEPAAEPDHARRPAVPANAVVAALRSFLGQRTQAASYRPPVPVASATPADVPAHSTSRAYPGNLR